MRENTRIRMKQRIESLTKDIETFNSYEEEFYHQNPFFGPSVHFHRRVIDMYRNNENYERLLRDTSFIEYIYATLASWGMHRMGPKGAKMRNYDEFKEEVLGAEDPLIVLSKHRLHELTSEYKAKVKERLRSIFLHLRIMHSHAKLVGNSKIMHHLLPDLVPPVDHQYTVRFFYGSKNPKSESEEVEMFLEIFDNFYLICKKLNLTEKNYLTAREFTTSIPKLIDNAIIGYCLKNLKGRQVSQK